ncbi:MAG: (2Fe-2S)-binding protein [Pseudolabrys sp.]
MTAVPISLTVNGKPVAAEVEPRTLLVTFLREHLRLTGTHIGCDTAQCGACTVHMNGRAIKSCSIVALQAADAEILTIEGLSMDGTPLHPMQQAFSEHHALQCGYCTPGMVMTALDIIKEVPAPTRDEVAHGLHGNLCRCTGYRNIIDAVLAGAKAMKEPKTDAMDKEP